MSTHSFIQLISLGQRQRVGEIIEQQRRAVLMPQIDDGLAALNRIGLFFGLSGLAGVTTGDRHAGVSFATWRAVSLQAALGSIMVLTPQMCRCSLVVSWSGSPYALPNRQNWLAHMVRGHVGEIRRSFKSSPRHHFRFGSHDASDHVCDNDGGKQPHQTNILVRGHRIRGQAPVAACTDRLPTRLVIRNWLPPLRSS
ncbi:MAG: hypothetical protein WBM81_04495, partial [Sedimenticolaceae bacterium]